MRASTLTRSNSRLGVMVLLLALPILALGLIGAIVASTAWHTVSSVHPPRLGVDTAEVQRDLPGSESVAFSAADGITLTGNFVPPRNGAVVVLVHGLFANREQLLPEAEFLSQHGYGVLIFDNRAHGDSGGTTATWGFHESDDVLGAVNYVVERTGVPSGRIALLGLSIGGTAVLREAGSDGRVGAVVVEATYSSMSNEIDQMYGHHGPLSEKTARLTAQVIGGLDYSQLVPSELLCGLGGRPLLLVYGSEDVDVPLVEGERMADAPCGPGSLVIVKTDTHGGFMQADQAVYPQRLLAFLDDNLR